MLRLPAGIPISFSGYTVSERIAPATDPPSDTLEKSSGTCSNFLLIGSRTCCITSAELLAI